MRNCSEDVRQQHARGPDTSHVSPLRRRLTAGQLPLVHPRARGPASPPPDRRAASPCAPARTRARIAAAWARHLARGPDDMHVGSAAHAHVERLTCVSKALTRIFSGSVRAPREARRRCAQIADHLARAPHCWRLSPRWSAVWVPHCPEPRPHRQQTGGIAAIEARHADDTPTGCV